MMCYKLEVNVRDVEFTQPPAPFTWGTVLAIPKQGKVTSPMISSEKATNAVVGHRPGVVPEGRQYTFGVINTFSLNAKAEETIVKTRIAERNDFAFFIK